MKHLIKKLSLIAILCSLNTGQASASATTDEQAFKFFFANAKILLPAALTTIAAFIFGSEHRFVPAFAKKAEAVKKCKKEFSDFMERFDQDSEKEQLEFLQKFLEDNQELLRQNSEILNQVTSENNTILHLAYFTKKFDIFMLLVRAGVNPNIKNNNGDTLLHCICQEDCDDDEDKDSSATDENIDNRLIPLLLEHRADPNIQNNLGETPLYLLCSDETIEKTSLVTLLLEQKADPNIQKNDGETSLEAAFTLNHTNILDILLACPRININQPGKHNRTLLHVALLNEEELPTTEHRALINRLLAFPGIDVNAKDDLGRTPLHLTCEGSINIELFDLLLSHGADINIQNNNKETILHFLCVINDDDDDDDDDDDAAAASVDDICNVITRVLDHGANINIQNHNGDTPLHYACNTNDITLFTLLLNRGATINTENNDKKTAFHILCEADDEQGGFLELAVATLFLDRGADINGASKEGRTPLHYACMENNNLDVVTLLLDRGATINTRDNNGDTPLHIACKDGEIEIATLLLDRGATRNITNNSGDTPLHIACARNNRLIVTLLLDRGDNINTPGNAGKTPLHIAVGLPSSALMRLLLQRQANKNIQDAVGKTPLHYICTLSDQSATIRRIQPLSTPENINMPDHNGYTPLHLFANKVPNAFTDQTIRLLIELGANINHQNQHGNTPLHFAHQKPNIQMFIKFLSHGGAPSLKIANHDGIKPNMNFVYLRELLQNFSNETGNSILSKIDQEHLIELITVDPHGCIWMIDPTKMKDVQLKNLVSYIAYLSPWHRLETINSLKINELDETDHTKISSALEKNQCTDIKQKTQEIREITTNNNENGKRDAITRTAPVYVFDAQEAIDTFFIKLIEACITKNIDITTIPNYVDLFKHLAMLGDRTRVKFHAILSWHMKMNQSLKVKSLEEKEKEDETETETDEDQDEEISLFNYCNDIQNKAALTIVQNIVPKEPSSKLKNRDSTPEIKGLIKSLEQRVHYLNNKQTIIENIQLCETLNSLQMLCNVYIETNPLFKKEPSTLAEPITAEEKELLQELSMFCKNIEAKHRSIVASLPQGNKDITRYDDLLKKIILGFKAKIKKLQDTITGSSGGSGGGGDTPTLTTSKQAKRKATDGSETDGSETGGEAARPRKSTTSSSNSGGSGGSGGGSGSSSKVSGSETGEEAARPRKSTTSSSNKRKTAETTGGGQAARLKEETDRALSSSASTEPSSGGADKYGNTDPNAQPAHYYGNTPIDPYERTDDASSSSGRSEHTHNATTASAQSIKSTSASTLLMEQIKKCTSISQLDELYTNWAEKHTVSKNGTLALKHPATLKFLEKDLINHFNAIVNKRRVLINGASLQINEQQKLFKKKLKQFECLLKSEEKKLKDSSASSSSGSGGGGAAH